MSVSKKPMVLVILDGYGYRVATVCDSHLSVVIHSG